MSRGCVSSDSSEVSINSWLRIQILHNEFVKAREAFSSEAASLHSSASEVASNHYHLFTHAYMHRRAHAHTHIHSTHTHTCLVETNAWQFQAELQKRV